MTELRGARVLVTGASGGLGRAIAMGLRAQGAELLLTGRRSRPLHELAAEVHGTAAVADLAGPGELDRLLEQAGEVDILVANAGVPASGELDDWDPDQIERALMVNLGSPIAMTRALLPRFRTRGSGHFVYHVVAFGPGRHERSIAVLGHQVRPAGLRRRVTGRPAW